MGLRSLRRTLMESNDNNNNNNNNNNNTDGTMPVNVEVTFFCPASATAVAAVIGNGRFFIFYF